MNIKQLHALFLAHPRVTTDSRNIEEQSIFFALKGANFNGNRYAKEALEKGAAYAVIDEEEFVVEDRTILVDDVLKTLQALATFHRNQSNAKVIALTGSNGKTTTKELIYAVLSTAYKTIATKGNLNNHIGVPLSLLSIAEDTEIAVIEMGANHQKEIEFLASIAQPDFGYITNFGKAHLEGFGGVEGVIKGKSELYDYLLANNRSVFMNADDSVQLEKLSNYIKKFGFSTQKSTYYKVEFLGADPFVQLKFEDMVVRTQLIGSYNFSNCAAAVLIGKYFNVPLSDIKNALEAYTPINNRSQILKKNGHRIVLDAYNANPTSMKAALESFNRMEGKHKIAFLGDMFELGDTAALEHQHMADFVSGLSFENVFLVGTNFYDTSTDLMKFATFDALSEHLSQNQLQKSAILIKGSRGMALERVLEFLE